MSESALDARLAREMEEFAAQLGRGAAILAGRRAVSIGAAPKDPVYREDKLVLYRYRPMHEADVQPVRTPLLICYALVNRPYVLDLQPDRSLIAGLLRRGIDVYLIDWGYPDGADRALDLEDYVLRYLANCANFVARESGQDRINLLGVCQGGTLSLCYAALHPQRLRNLITMVTPVDFHTPENLLTKWSRHVDVDALMATIGNVPGDWLNALFLALMPWRLTSQKYVHLLDELGRGAQGDALIENFLRMEQWIFDSPAQAGAMFRRFLVEFYRENRLARGELKIAGRRVQLQEIRVPVYNVYARKDHLVPPSSSMPLERLVSSTDYTAYEFNGGHIGVYVSAAAQREIPQRLARWLRQRDGAA